MVKTVLNKFLPLLIMVFGSTFYFGYRFHQRFQACNK